MDYEKKDKFRWRKCEVHEKPATCHQHHINHRRYGDKVIWVCLECHQKIHADPEWAYTEGYLEKHNKSYKIEMKPIKKKSCSHSKTLFDIRLGYTRCNFCGQKVESISFGSKTSRIAREVPKTTIKMGSEIQDPRIKKGEDLKKRLNKITLDIKKNASNKQEYERLKFIKSEIEGEMLKLVESYED